MPADIGAANWDEVDANNSTASPDGWPTGMAPSGVDNTGRQMMGAVKRFWDKINAVKTTAGTTSAYTLTYAVAPGALVDGEIISFVVHATNAAAATLNVNALGAIPLRLFGGNLLAGALLANDIVQARYGSAAGAFDIIPQNGWVRIGEQDPSAASTVDFTSIPAGVKHLQCVFEGAVGTDGDSLALRTYGADGVLDTGALDYSYVGWLVNSGAITTVSTSTTTRIDLTGAIDSGGINGFHVVLNATNIQAARTTKFTIQSAYFETAGTVYACFNGNGCRNEADRITGIRLLPVSGNFTGKATLYGSA